MQRSSRFPKNQGSGFGWPINQNSRVSGGELRTLEPVLVRPCAVLSYVCPSLAHLEDFSVTVMLTRIVVLPSIISGM